jgi:dihydrofolate synthase/folylpolyglutamate synthase
MNYQECIDYLYNQLPVFHRVGSSAFKRGLDNVVALSEALGNPHHQFKTIHIAGTNGKGSTSNMLAAVLQSAGYKTGLYTSPHLKEFTERIRIDGQDLPPAYLVDFVEEHRHLFETIQPSFFEMTVALAFRYFADQQVDIAVVEVGLGGRLDSTNIIHPQVSLITNISLDHQQILGDDLPTIAREKAGIIKDGVPVVISKTQPEVADVFREVAQARQAPLFFADQIYQVAGSTHEVATQVLDITRAGAPFLDNLELSLGGFYQQFNVPGVLQVVALLQEQGYRIEETHIREGLQNVNRFTGFKGRWQMLSNNPLTICDTGHNEDGIKQVVEQLLSLQAPRVHVVFGMVQDKDVRKVLQLLPPAFTYYFTQASLPRALPVKELQELAAGFGLQGQAFPEVNAALAAARQAAAPEDVIFVGGSTFVVAEIDEL